MHRLLLLYPKCLNVCIAHPFPPPDGSTALLRHMGGVQPDTDEVHIPAGQKSDVKGWYDEELQCGNTDLTPVSGQHFNKVWAKSVPHLKCRAFLRWVCLCACMLVLNWLCHLSICSFSDLLSVTSAFWLKTTSKKLARTFTRGKFGKKRKKSIVNM